MVARGLGPGDPFRSSTRRFSGIPALGAICYGYQRDSDTLHGLSFANQNRQLAEREYDAANSTRSRAARGDASVKSLPASGKQNGHRFVSCEAAIQRTVGADWLRNWPGVADWRRRLQHLPVQRLCSDIAPWHCGLRKLGARCVRFDFDRWAVLRLYRCCFRLGRRDDQLASVLLTHPATG